MRHGGGGYCGAACVRSWLGPRAVPLVLCTKCASRGHAPPLTVCSDGEWKWNCLTCENRGESGAKPTSERVLGKAPGQMGGEERRGVLGRVRRGGDSGAKARLEELSRGEGEPVEFRCGVLELNLNRVVVDLRTRKKASRLLRARAYRKRGIEGFLGVDGVYPRGVSARHERPRGLRGVLCVDRQHCGIELRVELGARAGPRGAVDVGVDVDDVQGALIRAWGDGRRGVDVQ